VLNIYIWLNFGALGIFKINNLVYENIPFSFFIKIRPKLEDLRDIMMFKGLQPN